MNKITIIAEIGINHNGDMQQAMEMIQIAKEAGADIAKFQIYDPEKVLDKNDPEDAPYWDMLLETELTKEWVIRLKAECDRLDIEFLASVFAPKTVEWTEEIGMRQYKIASRSVYDRELAEAIAATGKPVMVSYGMIKDNKSPEITEISGINERLKHLYCLAIYPTPLEKFEFFRGNGSSIFRSSSSDSRSRRFDGFSEHSTGVGASIFAMALGATIIEKHFTLDKEAWGPDHTSSITPSELKFLCDVRNYYELL